MATLDDSICTLQGSSFKCSPRKRDAQKARLTFGYHKGVRVKVEQTLPEAKFLGTAGGPAFVGTERLGSPALPDRHITALE